MSATAIDYRSGTLSVAASAAAPSLIRRAVGGREGRVTVKGSSVSPLQLAEETLRALERAA